MTPYQTVQWRFADLSKHELYVVDLDGDALFAAYLAAFPAGTNPIFRTRTEHDCNCCKQFIRNLGRVVAIINGKIETVWDVQVPAPYDVVYKALHDLVLTAPIKTIFRTTKSRYGQTHNYDKVTNARYEHFVGDTTACADPGAKRSEAESAVQVFRRGCEELTAIDQVLYLLPSLYRGKEHQRAVTSFKALQTGYKAATDKNTFLWAHYKNAFARFRNTVIGTLAVDWLATNARRKT